ncbi:MAG: WYL domain-containing protein [Halomonas sp.]|nr:WYL domain-containing protein [Halomonas sp.]
MPELATIPWDTLARYRLIEILALWEGRVTASQIGEAFGIGREQAQKVLKAYREKVAPGNLDYDASRKGWVPLEAFTPRVTQGSLDEYLHLLGTYADLNSPFAGLGLGAADTESLPMPNREASPRVVRALVHAAREGLRLEARYASFNTPQGEERILVPHTLVFAAGRWHVRAFCEKHRDFRDFVLTRFRGVPEPMGCMLDTAHAKESDSDWHTFADVRLIPDRRLSLEEREMLMVDYGMSEGELKLSCRGPLVLYALRQLGVNPHHAEAEPRAQQIEIANRSALDRWIRWE